MVSPLVRSLSFLIWTFMGHPALALDLNPEKVAQLVLDKSERAREINATASLSRLERAQAESVFDYKLSFKTGFEKSKFEPLASSGSSDLDQSYLSELGMQKTLASGTLLELKFLRSSIRYDLFPTATSSRDQVTQNTLTLTATQSLWRNAWGSADRKKVESSELRHESSQISRVDNLESLVLEAVQLYWKTYVSQESLKESLRARDRYQKLVEAVKKKAQLGYSNPGELPQVQAEFEIRQQNVKSASNAYLSNLKDLRTLLNLDPNSSIEFSKVPEELPSPPASTEATNDFRPVVAAKKNEESARLEYEAAKALNRSDVSFIGAVGTSGTDTKATEADNEFFAGTRPQTYIGVQLQTSFGSGLQEETALNKKLSYEIASLKRSRTERESQDKLFKARNLVQEAYSGAVSARLQKDFRAKAAEDIQRTYAQGRTDISILIETLNKAMNSQVDYLSAFGRYQSALVELAAIEDELIKDQESDPHVPQSTGGNL